MSEEKEKVQVFETPDLGFASYLKMKGLELTEISKNERRYKFIFNIKDENLDKLKVKFINSESYKFDSNVRILKLMIKSDDRVNG